VQFVEGNLDETGRGQVHAHVDTCASCRKVVAQLAVDSDPRLDRTDPSPGAAPGLAKGARLGRYTVERFVGSGAMGAVYLATDPALARPVALKLLRQAPSRAGSELQRRLLREAQAMARLSHPNVVSVYEVATEGEPSFVAMEFVEGASLRAWLLRSRPWQETLRTLIAAGRGLAAAHARGLVHRDFKPDNVLIGADARPRVTDFGLAAAAGELPEAAPAPGLDAPALATPLTRTGALLGTPAYMAPETLEGRETTALSDQFSFCVTAVEGLAGRRPFDGASLAELVEARKRPPELPSRGPVPRAVWRALERGLSADPAARWPSLDALLDALDAVLKPRRWPLVAAASVAAAALALAALAAGRSAPSCEVPADALGGVWDAAVRDRVRTAMLATNVPYAQVAAARAQETLDARAAAWMTARREACEATWVKRTQSEQLLDRRMRCLDAAKEELRAAGVLFSKIDEGLVGSAGGVLAALRPLEWCADERMVSASIAPPPPDQAAEVADVRTGLAGQRPIIAAKPPAAVERLTGLVKRARATKHGPLLAEALVELAAAQVAASDAKASEASAREAMAEADAAGDDFDRARALIVLLEAVGAEQARWPEGDALAQSAAAVIKRLGGDPTLSARLELQHGRLYYTQSRYDDALPHYRRALELSEQRFGKEHPAVADVLQLLAICTGSKGQLDEARALYERALKIRETALGPTHPDVAATLNTLAIDSADRGDHQKALELFERALDIRVKALGPGHSRVGHVLTNMAGSYLALGDAAKAAETVKQAIDLEEKSMGADHPGIAEPYHLWCEALAALGKAAEAEAACRHAVELASKKSPTHVRVGLAHLSWTEALLKLQRPADALQHAKLARPPMAARIEASDAYMIQLDVAEASALVELHRESEAKPIAERILKSLEVNHTASPELVARARKVALVARGP